jgi:polar amino acid transport system substrate-binding protein
LLTRSIIALCTWLAFGFSGSHAAVVSLCADSWCPYNCEPDSDRPGFAVQIAQEVFGAAGYKVDYEVVNWARCVEDARNGRYDGIIGAIHTDAPDFIFPAERLAISSDGYAFRSGDTFHFTGEKSLQGRVLGVIRDYNFSGPIGAYLAAHGNDPSRIEYIAGEGALAKNLAKLVAGRVDLVLDDANVLRDAIARLGLQNQVRLDQGPNRTPTYIAFSPASPEAAHLAGLLDAGIASLRRSGRLAQILALYHVQDEP